MVSLIIPTYNEAAIVPEALQALSLLRGDFEVIVADGGSTDPTPEKAEAWAAGFGRPWRVIIVPRPRAAQLNHAAALARGDILLFLHADARPSPQAIDTLEQALADPAVVGGNFALRFEGGSRWNRLFTWANWVRRRWGIYYGDSGLFVRREVFERLGGFKPIPIMEDYEFVRRLERAGRTVCLPATVHVSDRRWRVKGVARALTSWIWIQGLYSLGVPAERLARWYRPVREGAPEQGAPRKRFRYAVKLQRSRPRAWARPGGQRTEGRT